MSIIVLMTGLLLLGIGIASLVRRMGLKSACTAHTEGIVSQIRIRDRAKKNNDGATAVRRMLYPEFTYTAEGITYVQQAKTGSTRTKFREGQSVTVHYNPAAPEEWFVGADKNDVIFSCVFMIFGMIIAVCSFVMEVD